MPFGMRAASIAHEPQFALRENFRGSIDGEGWLLQEQLSE